MTNAVGMLILALGAAGWIVSILLALIPERVIPPMDFPYRPHVDMGPRPYDWSREPSEEL